MDEAHRTQYGRLALNQRNALPRARYIALTGTPLMEDDELTCQVFGVYVSRYGFQRAVEDGPTVPLYFETRGEKLGIGTNELNQKIADKLEEFENDEINVEQCLELELRREYDIITAPKRFNVIAKDFVAHYSIAWESDKAMFVVINKITAVKTHELIAKYWKERITKLEAELSGVTDD